MINNVVVLIPPPVEQGEAPINISIIIVITLPLFKVDKSKINTTDKYVGYNFEKIEPQVIPDTVNNGYVIKAVNPAVLQVTLVNKASIIVKDGLISFIKTVPNTNKLIVIVNTILV